MNFLDWTIIALYLAGMLAIGLWAMRKIHDPGGFLLGKRKMGKMLMIASTFSAGTAANDPVTVASYSYQHGVPGIWLSLYNLFLTPLFWLMPPAYRRLRMVTMVDFIRMRYGRVLEIFYNVVQTAVSVLAIAAAIAGAGKVAAGVTHGAVPEYVWDGLITLIILAYALPGGVIAVFTTDILQSLLIVVLSFVLLPFAAYQIGGFSGITEQLVKYDFSSAAEIFGKTVTPAFIFWACLGGVFSVMAESRQAAHGGARNEMSARYSMFGMFMKRICTVGWMMAGVFAIGYYGAASAQVKPDQIFARMSADVLPMGLLGLTASSVLAAAIAAASGGMVFGSSIVLNNIYREFFVPKASPAHYLAVARISGALMVIVGGVLASQVGDLVDFTLKVAQVGTVVGLPIGCALFWRRGTRNGAIAAALVMLPLFVYGTFYTYFRTLLGSPQLDALCENYPADGIVPADFPFKLLLQVWTPLYFIPGLLTFVIVSLLTRQHNQRSVDEFYARLDTPVGEEHRLREQGFQVDLLEKLDKQTVQVEAKDHDVSKRLLLVDLLAFPYRVLTGKGKLSDYKIDFIGIGIVLAFGLALLAVIMAFAWAIRPA